MKPFNLNEYLSDTSRKVVTRDGRSVRIICTDAKQDYSIVALLTHCEDLESVMCYTKDGRRNDDVESQLDLFFATKQGEGWVNIYRIADTDQLEASCIFGTKEEAEFYRGDDPKPNCVATTKVTWEE